MKRIYLLHKIKELGFDKDNLLEPLFKEVLRVYNPNEENFDKPELTNFKNMFSKQK